MVFDAPESVLTGNEVTTVESLPGIRISQSNGCTATKNMVTGAYKKREVWFTGSENYISEDNIIK